MKAQLPDLSFIPLGIAILVLSYIATLIMIRVGIHDVPIRRSSHQKITPKSGGVGIIIGFFFGMGVLYTQGKLGHVSTVKLALLTVGALLTVLVSLIDDVRRLSSAQKLIVQIIAGLFVIGAGLKLSILPTPLGIIKLGTLGSILGFFWIIFFINVFNFMDGLNGLASGTSIISCFFCAAIAFFLNEIALFYVSFCLGVATLGFFFLNFPKAKIFMGDVGSQFIGLLWAVLLLIPSQEAHASTMNFSVYTVPLLFFSFIYDVSMTVIRRIWRREAFWLAHRTHLFQLLNRLGYSHAQVTYFHLGMAVLQGIGAILMQKLNTQYQILVFIPYLLFMASYHAWVTKKVFKKFARLHRKKRKLKTKK